MYRSLGVFLTAACLICHSSVDLPGADEGLEEEAPAASDDVSSEETEGFLRAVFAPILSGHVCVCGGGGGE